MRKLLRALPACALAGLISPAFAQNLSSEYTLDIDPLPLSAAIVEFCRQTGLQVGGIPEDPNVENIVVPALKGTYTAEEALGELLQSTGLTFKRTDSRTIAVMPTASASIGYVDPLWESNHSNVEVIRLASLVLDDQTASDAKFQKVAADQQGDSPAATVGRVQEVEEIVVTGSHIRGVQNETAPVYVYDRAAIDRRGYISTQEFIRSLPQNFEGGENGASEDGYIGSVNGLSNVENASGVNLRGLGTSSTLVLLNGHRVAPAAFGSAVDVSVIPLAAIDRIEVLTDGASSIYGSDAVGGVVNFQLREDYTGAETLVQAGTVTSGSRSQYVVGQTIGASWSTGSVLASLQYEDAGNLRSTDRSFTARLPQPNDLYPAVTRRSGLIAARQDLPGHLYTYADVLHSHDDEERYYRQPTRTHHNMTDGDFISAHGGVGWADPNGWRVEGSYLLSEMDVASAAHFDPVRVGYANGSLYGRNTFELSESNIIADGPLFNLPGGLVRAAMGASYRIEDFTSAVPWVPLERLFDRNVHAAFAEFNVPLVSESNRVPGFHRVTLSASARYDDYSDFGETINPKLGVLWSPTPNLDFRATYGTSFHAPDVAQQIDGSANLMVFNHLFSMPGGGTAPVLVVVGNLNLQPEKSRNFTVGGEYRPSFLPGLRLSWNYYDVRYRDRLVTPPFDTTALLKRDVYGPLIAELESDAAAAAYVASLVSQGFDFVDATQTGTAGVRYVYNFSLMNASQVRQRGFDVGMNYRFDGGVGQMELELDATYIDHIRTGFCSSCTTINLVDRYGQPLRTRLRGGLVWSLEQLQLGLAVNYAGSYKDTNITPSRRVDDHATVDLVARYSPAFWDGLTFGLNVINVFDEDPPRTAGGFTFRELQYDSANADPLGRFVSLQIRKTW